MMRSIALSKNVVLLSVLAMAANANATLPDEIDYRTYLSSYTQAKSQSDSARMSADQLKSLINDIVAQLEINGSTINATERDIDEAVALITQLSSENMDLETTIAQLGEENLGLNDELIRLAQNIKALENDQYRLEGDLAGPRNSEQNLRRALNSVEKSIQKNGDDLERAQKIFNRNKDEIQSLESKITKAIDEHDRLQKRIPNIQKDLNQTKQNLSQAQSQVSTFESQVSQAKTELQAANQAVADIKTKIDQVENKIKKQEEAIGPLIQKRNKLKQQLSAAQSEVSSKTSELNSAKKELADAKGKVDTLKSQKDLLASQKAQLENKKSKMEADLAVVETALKDLTGGGRDPGKGQQIKELRLRRKALRDKIAETETKITKVSADLTKAQADLKATEQIIAQGQGKINALQSAVASAKQKAQQAANQLKAVETEIANASPQLDKLKQRLATLKSEFTNVTRTQVQAKAKLDEKSAKLAQVKKDITRLQQDIAKLQKEKGEATQRLALVNSDIKKLKRDLKKEQDQFDSNRRAVASLRNTQKALVAERESYERRLSVVMADIRVIMDRLDDVHARLLASREDQDRFSQQFAQNQQTINQANTTMDQNSQAISSKRSMIASAESRIQDLQRQNESLQDKKYVKEAEFAKADTVANELESITASKFSAYEERKDLYSQYEGEARELGASQGETAGATAGEYKGSRDVSEDGQHFGKINGLKIGELKGYLAGLLDGKDDGLEAGYADGLNSQSSYDEGYAKGYEVGVETAKKLAKSESYPQGYESVKNEAFSNLPTNKIVLSNSVNGSIFMEKAFAFASEMTNALTDTYDFITPEYAAPERALKSFTSRVDQEVSRVRAEIEAYENNKEKAKALPQYVYTAPTRIDIDEDFKNCFDVYKGVSEFKQACGKSYDSAYKMQFTSSHKDTYFAGYVAYFSQARDEASAGNFSKDTQSGFDKAYKIAYAEARLEGEGAAYQNGADAGEEAGFDENIAKLKSEMLALGKSDAKKLFATTGVVRLAKAGQTTVKTEDPKGLTQNGKFSVGLGLVNFGKLATNRGAISAKVVSSTSNVVVVDPTVNLRTLPAQAQIDLSDVIQAKVANNARPGSEVSMQIELTYPGDAVGSSYTELATFTSNVLVNPEIQVGLDFSDEVKDRKCTLGLFNCRYRSHDVKVKLTGLRDFVPGEYDVAISVLEGEKYVDLKKAATKIASPGKGVTATGALTYKFKKKTKDDKLKFKVQVSYNGELLATKVIDVKAK